LDFETGARVESKVGNLPSKFGHARPLGSGIILFAMYVTDGQTDGQTKATLIAPFPTLEDINISFVNYSYTIL